MTRVDIAIRFRVSLGMVKKLISQRRRGDGIGSLRHRCSRKPMIKEEHREHLRKLLVDRPDMTLEEMRECLGLDCTVQAIHYVLSDMGLTYKKRHFERANNTAQT